jgi:hypothetical protein
MIKSLAVAALATAVAGEEVRTIGEPHVQFYAHQWDLVDVDFFHALFSSTYNAELSSEMFKAPADTGRFNIGWRAAGRLSWEINLGMNILDFFYVIIQSKVMLLDTHPIKLQMTIPDYVDQYAAAMANPIVPLPTCLGLEFDTSVLNVATTLTINFKRMEISLLDIFNADVSNATQDIDNAENLGGGIADDNGSGDSDSDQQVLLLKQSNDEEECVETDEDGNAILDEEGNPVPCAVLAEVGPTVYDNQSEWTQEDFAVDAQDININWIYQQAGESTISNLAQYAGWTWTVPIYQVCWQDPMYQTVFRTVFDGFFKGLWGESVSKTYP